MFLATLVYPGWMTTLSSSPNPLPTVEQLQPRQRWKLHHPPCSSSIPHPPAPPQRGGQDINYSPPSDHYCSPPPVHLQRGGGGHCNFCTQRKQLLFFISSPCMREREQGENAILQNGRKICEIILL